MVMVVLCAVISLATPADAQTPTPDGWVVLSIDEYRALRSRAIPDPPPPAPPFDAALTRVDYDLHADGETMTGTALLTIDVFRDGWTRIPLPLSLVVRDARLDGRPVPIVDPSTTPGAGGGPRYLLLPRAGRFVVTLDIVIPITASGGAESIVLPASPAPLSRAVIALAGGGAEMIATGALIGEHETTAAESRWTAFGSANQPMMLSWKRKADDRKALQALRTRARIASVIGFGEEVALVSATVRVEVLAGLARNITLALPPGLAVNQVNGPMVADWTVSGSSLDVRLLDPVAGDTSFVVQGEIKTDREGKLPVPLIRMPAAERETGGVVVDVTGAGEVTEHVARGLEPTDVSELADVVAGRESPSMTAFRLKPAPGTDVRSLTIGLVRYAPQAIPIANVEAARFRLLAAEDGRLLVEARYAIRNNQRSFARITLPPGSTIWSATVGGRPVRPGVAGTDAVLLPLEKGRSGGEPPVVSVELLYLQPIESWIEKPTARVQLPAIDLAVSVTGVALFYSPRYQVEAKAGEFRVEADEQSFVDAIRGPAPSEEEADSKTFGQRSDPKLQSLIDMFAKDSHRSSMSLTPVRIPFPDWGPSLLLRSELTPESHTPVIELSLDRTRSR
jgi:hypothetical protein